MKENLKPLKVNTIDELKPHLLELHKWFFQWARKLGGIEKMSEEQAYEYGKACGGEEAVSVICLLIGMPVYDMWQAELEKAKEIPDLS